MKKILITGGAGFLGSHLCERLLKEGNKIFCLDNFYTGRKQNIEALSKNINFEIIKHDIINPFSIEVDEIYNLACPASPVHYQSDPIKTTKTSVLGALNMLELAQKQNAKIFQASTSEIYGNPEVHPQTESYNGYVNPIGIRACYDEGKRCAESLFLDYHRQYNVNIKIVRIFNTYGPRMNPEDGRVVSNFIVQALRNENITMYGDGTQTRSFCYVDDLINGFIQMMNSNNDFHGPVNLGNSNEFTVMELAELVIRLTNSKSKIIFNDIPLDDPVRRKPDLTLAEKQLDYKINILLEQGIEKTISYFKEELKR